MAKHTSPQDPSFRASLLRHLGGGAALIVVVAVAFLGIGQLGQQTATPSAADVPGQDEEPEAVEPEDEDVEESEERHEPDEPEEVAEPEPEEPDDAEPEPDDTDEPADEEPDDGNGDDEAPAPAEETSAPAFAASEISLQVLDGVGTDGGNAARQMAQRLRDGGFNVIAENPALAYETTTVLWTSGNEAKARQVAAEIGAGAVRPQPGNLSESVDVHVVVGADRA